MTYLATCLMIIWIAGLLYLAGRWMNDLRLVLNSLTPDARLADYTYSNYFGITIVAHWINPEKLTDAGRAYRKNAVWTERVLFAWTIGGFVLNACASYYSGV